MDEIDSVEADQLRAEIMLAVMGKKGVEELLVNNARNQPVGVSPEAEKERQRTWKGIVEKKRK